MNVTLTSELEELVERKIKSGRFSSAGEVVRESLFLLDREDEVYELKLEQLRREILKAEEQFEKGQFHSVGSKEEWGAFLEGVIERGRKRLAEEKGEIK